jgi:hypothetical protein
MKATFPLPWKDASSVVSEHEEFEVVRNEQTGLQTLLHQQKMRYQV